jgi:hypothetical protein
VRALQLHHTNQPAQRRPEYNMTKLIESFRKCPTQANRIKLQKYINKHMMAVCMATPDELAFLKANEFTI